VRATTLPSFVLALCSVLVGCGSNDSSPGSGGVGGNSGLGGVPPVGGSAGNGGSAANGGNSPNGGATSNGGSSAGAGGDATVGGTTSAGGSSSAAGGISPAGGATTTGGSKAAGGSATGAGATSTGGSNAAGGTKAGGGTSSTSGGTKAVGGTAAAGGTAATGGTAASTSGTKAAGGTAATGGATGTAGSTSCTVPTVTLTGTDAVAGTKITFNDNGGWCWYQDERAVVDVAGGKLIIGSISGTGSRVGNIEAVIYDLKTGTKSGPTKLGNLSVDDHDAPAFAVRPDGKYVAVWATHRSDCNTYYSIYSGSSWGAQQKFDWATQGCPWNSDNTHMITYSNVWYMGTTLYDIARSVDTSPNLLSSADDGQTWNYYGRMTYTPLTGYVAGYYKYWGNNTDRIDFVGTEAHPRDNDNSLWHGYMQGGKIYNSAGTVVDDALAGTSASSSAQNIDKYTKVFGTGSTPGGSTASLCRMWNHDIVRYADGTIAILGQGRANNCTSTPSGSDPDKRLIYMRWDGTSWKTTYLTHSGPKLYADEEDYTGLGAMVPDDPTTIYISTTYDPNKDTAGSSGKREIWRGTTCDKGATFTWTPVTANSTKDNIRPIVPKWDATHTALLWMQGSYVKAQDYNEAIVGVISGQ
jgi:hypothetical protein